MRRALVKTLLGAAGVVLIVALAMPCRSAQALDAWGSGDVALEALYAGVHATDWAQTRWIAAHPERVHENNPILGEHPSDSRVNVYFASTLAAHAVVTWLLPREAETFGWKWNPRRAWQAMTIGGEATMVGWNINMGIGTRW